MDKRRSYSVLVEGYFTLMYLFGFINFYCFIDSVVFFTSPETNLYWSVKLLSDIICTKSQNDTLQGASVLHIESFETIVMFLVYSDSLIFLFIHSLSTNVKPG